MDQSRTQADALAELLELTSRLLHSRGYANDLFPAQWMALRYFARAQPEKRTASELARFQGLANGPVSRTVRTLISKGLVAKTKEQPKGRAETLELTAVGQRQMQSDPQIEIAGILRELPANERAALARALEMILRSEHGPSLDQPQRAGTRDRRSSTRSRTSKGLI